MAKEFGLIIPTKNERIVQAPGKRAAIFDEESDSDESGAATKPNLFNSREKKFEKLAQLKAMDEDPTVFQYDEIYDHMEKQRKHLKLSEKNIDKKPKYINNLLKAAERRKRENERRIERIVQKEREIEGDEFKDKESYVTPSYQNKLQEMKALEEKEKREEYLESIGDVRKQENLDGFYRYIYHQEVNNEDDIEEVLSDVDHKCKEKDEGLRKACPDNDQNLYDTNIRKYLKNVSIE
ncbi:hypothetical protein WA026_012767 [Henosepilachna vigintioctopunctata]|uniref:Nuclear speckle splicing regulatory protein 1 N-terminal domain-containing protein n=1 Tax=Henosepilachna vigintioctopunctata TaxID=420089 RepID=A0AAW1U752_9CUCU